MRRQQIVEVAASLAVGVGIILALSWWTFVAESADAPAVPSGLDRVPHWQPEGRPQSWFLEHMKPGAQEGLQAEAVAASEAAPESAHLYGTFHMRAYVCTNAFYSDPKCKLNGFAANHLRVHPDDIVVIVDGEHDRYWDQCRPGTEHICLYKTLRDLRAIYGQWGDVVLDVR